MTGAHAGPDLHWPKLYSDVQSCALTYGMNVCSTLLSLHADLRNVAHARQRLVVCDDDMLRGAVTGSIRGVAVTPGGRLLVAHSVSSVSPRALRLLLGTEGLVWMHRIWHRIWHRISPFFFSAQSCPDCGSPLNRRPSHSPSCTQSSPVDMHAKLLPCPCCFWFEE